MGTKRRSVHAVGLLSVFLLTLNGLANVNTGVSMADSFAELARCGPGEDISFWEPSALAQWGGLTWSQSWDQTCNLISDWGYDTVRICFTTGGVKGAQPYDAATMDTILDKIYAVGARGILNLHNVYNDVSYFGTAAWITFWEGMATTYLGDDRVYAFEIYNEPWAEGLPPYSGNWTFTSTAIRSCVDAIRAIDPNRAIIIPFCATDTVSPPYFWGAPNFTSEVTSLSNVYFAYHGWHFDYNGDETINANRHIADLDAYIGLYGTQRVWAGELGKSAGSLFITLMVQACVIRGVGFNLLEHTRYRSSFDAQLFNVDYTPGPTQQYYTVHLLAGTGGSTSQAAGTYTRIAGITFTVTAGQDTGYTFTEWMLTGSSYSTATAISLTGLPGQTYVLQPVFTPITAPLVARKD